ncbi:ferrichrome Fe3+-siderophore transporter permease FecCD [Acetobacter estunensis NRIC 0472]|uniref:Iron chelate uptake ABC transporter family permease subunit n=1 Tax=Acetobacter estunensis TaxID=104097 RepID=A0A967EH58_9PROT|nr:iron ABC transporter permease [Acetobacter estunensis]NHO53197.1 iron chelate uptake ABC transporter family permease subunit [Acetobacter estunensis]GBQ24991.1 ferrichrome Fe3+-siderophore transporter permease FecCD [Acetobacter estunensis NRIC 0472]
MKSSDVIVARHAWTSLIHRRLGVLAGLTAALCGCFLANLSIGPVPLSLSSLFHTLLHGNDGSAAATVVWHLRLPFAVMAILTGFALGLAGAEMQTILDNPLASPFTLGLSAAAAFGASLAIVMGWHLPFGAAWGGEGIVAVNAFIFAIGSALLLDLIARWRGGTRGTVVLFGIALVFTFQALVALVQFVASEDALQDLVFWTMGSMTRANWPKIAVLGGACLLVAPWSLRSAWSLTALRMGEDRAASLGVNVPAVRLASLMRISILAALAVAFSGTIGFVGLVAPHIARRLLGEDHRFYLSGSAVVGCLIMSCASLAARGLLPGEVLPVGIVTALVGIPFFLATVLRDGRTS